MGENTLKGETPRADKFHREIHDLKVRLLELARLAANAMEKSLAAFVHQDRDLARQVMAGDAAINSLEEAIDGECVRLIALFQPVAIDLRQVMAVDHIIAELERIGDSATNIAEEVLTLEKFPPRPVHDHLPQMAQDVLEMLRESLKAFLDRDTRLAREVCRGLDRSLPVEVVLAPPYTALAAVAEELAGSRVKLAAQDTFWEPQGAFSGAISPVMLKEDRKSVV